MAQPLTLCCLSSTRDVMKSSFHPSTPRHQAGHFSIVGTRGGKDDEAVLGKETAGFHKVLKEQLQPGDEVAIKPGKQTLEYR